LIVSTGYSNVSRCEDGYVLDSTNGLCYLALSITLDYDAMELGSKGCYKYKADVLTFEIDSQIKELLTLLKSGKSINGLKLTKIFFFQNCFTHKSDNSY